ncbi:MAG: zinc ribbon domain-containing protein, partial [Asgard group archaeon]|nr:zinc ribbon domain-containing protein [Asgard group archaeon]
LNEYLYPEKIETEIAATEGTDKLDFKSTDENIEEESKTKKCTNCGATIKETSAYCTKCGHAINVT